MRRLYLRIYLAVLVSLAVFALCSGLVWRQFGYAGSAGHAFEVAATLAQNVLPAAARTVGLRDDGFHGNARFSGETPERGHSEFRRSTKDDAHGGHPRATGYHSPVFRNLRMRRLIKSLLSMLRCWIKRMPFR